MNELKIFEKSDFGQIRVNQNEYGEPLFCLADVCKALNLQVQNTKSRLSEDGVCSINLIDSMGRTQTALFINEQNLYKAIFQSRKKEAEKFVDWVTGEVLPSIRKNGKYETRQAEQAQIDSRYLNQKMNVAKFAMDALNMSDASRLAIVRNVCEGFGIPLPDYAPAGGVLKSATELLHDFGIHISTRDFNSVLVETGILEINTRKKKDGTIKTFKSLTEDFGVKFGENLVCPNNPLEVMPKYYVGKFHELLILCRFVK